MEIKTRLIMLTLNFKNVELSKQILKLTSNYFDLIIDTETSVKYDTITLYFDAVNRNNEDIACIRGFSSGVYWGMVG